VIRDGWQETHLELPHARFAEGECDVQVRGGALDKGTTVVVKSIDGPMVFVVAAETAVAEPETPASGQE